MLVRVGYIYATFRNYLLCERIITSTSLMPSTPSMSRREKHDIVTTYVVVALNSLVILLLSLVFERSTLIFSALFYKFFNKVVGR